MKKVILIGTIILVILGGFFLWWVNQKPKVSYSEDYVIKETSEGKILKNDKMGLTFIIPENWEVDYPYLYILDFISLESPDATINGRIVTEGCKITVTLDYIKESITNLEKHFRQINELKSITNDIYEVVKIDNQDALKNTWEEPEISRYGIGIYIPTKKLLIKNKLYILELFANIRDEERCSQELNKFLEAFSIY